MAGLLPPANGVVKKEIVQLVGADHALRVLNVPVIVGWNQLGADLGPQHGFQRVFDGRFELVRARRPAYQILDQRLGHTGIDCVMAHLITHAIGAPAERQFGKVARSDDEALVVACQAEQVIGAKARLHILESNVVMLFPLGEGMVHIGEHLLCGGPDVDLFRRRSESFHQFPGIGFRVVRCGKPRHGVGADHGSGQTQPVAGLGGDDQRMGGIEPTRNADYQAFRSGRLHPAHQRIDLDIERLVSVMVQLVLTIRNEGKPAGAAT